MTPGPVILTEENVLVVNLMELVVLFQNVFTLLILLGNALAMINFSLMMIAQKGFTATPTSLTHTYLMAVSNAVSTTKFLSLIFLEIHGNVKTRKLISGVQESLI